MSSVSVLNAHYHKGALPFTTKQFVPTNPHVIGYGKSWEYAHNEYEVENIDDLSMLLTVLENQPHHVIIRGELLPTETNPNCVLRRKDPRPARNGKPAERAYYRERACGVLWFMADFDKVPSPAGLTDNAERLAFLIGLLDEPFHDVTFHYAWSSSAGLCKPWGHGLTTGWETLSCHVWFWLEQPQTDSAMMRWAEHQDIDDAVMRTVQPNYTAFPVFHPGVIDPFANGGRSGLVRGERNAVPPFDPPAPPPVLSPKEWHARRTAAWTSGLAIPATIGEAGFDARLANIGPRLHMPIQRAIGAWVAQTSYPHDVENLKRIIRDRLLVCPTNDQDLEQYTNDQYLDRSIGGAIAKYSRGVVPGLITHMPETPLERMKYQLSKAIGREKERKV